MTDPRFRFRQPKKTISIALTSSAAAIQGEMACLDTSTGKLVPGQASTTLIPLGYFEKTSTGDGTTEVVVDLFENLTLHYFDNDTVSAVVSSDKGSSCYVKDARTVSHSSAGSTRSVAGIVLDLDSVNGVGVLFGLPVKGATGASGLAATVATAAALKAIAAADRSDGMRVEVLADKSKWIFDATNSDSLGSDGSDQLTIAPTAGTGVWKRNESCFDMRIAISKDNTDAQALSTIPTGYTLKIVDDPHWVVTTGFTGGSSSAIGISTSNAAGSTKGDILGGASGDVTATLGTAGAKAGTAGAKMDTVAHRRAMLLVAADTIRFDRITSAFTAGAGYVDIPVCFALAK